MYLADDVYLAAMYALKLFMNLQGSKSDGAFCQLYRDVAQFGGLDRAGTSLLTIAASRLAYYNSHKYINFRFWPPGGQVVLIQSIYEQTRAPYSFAKCY